MGKNDFLTPKAIANRIKAKGLQKLRWYCQMCQKQCRDENGFKCHTMSESHQRQMQVFGMNPERFVEGYSEEFLESFMELMKRSHRFSRVAASVVYNEFINDRNHVHMNSTKWLTLTDFIQYLGREGLCKVEDTPKGWFISYIDRESETVFKEKLKEKRERAELAEQERHEKEIQEQIERAAKSAKRDDQADVTEEQRALQRDPENGEKIAFAFGGGKAKEKPDGEKKKQRTDLPPVPLFAEDDAEDGRGKKENGKGREGEESVRKSNKGKGNLESLIQENERAKEKKNRTDYWLTEGIIVKVMSPALKSKGYYKEKGVVVRVKDKYVAEIEMLNDGAVVRVDQEELETVLPKIGGLVRIVNGAYRGSKARLVSVDVDRFCAKVEIVSGVYEGRVLGAIEYEDICKLETQ